MEKEFWLKKNAQYTRHSLWVVWTKVTRFPKNKKRFKN